MAMIQDASVGFGIESTFNTGVTPTRWVEFLSETFDWSKGTKQGKGLRVGLVGDNANRRTNPTAQGSGDLTMEACSKGMGLLLKAMMGNGVSTLVSGATYQQNFTLASSSALQSATIQKGLPDISGSVQAVTFTGATCDSFELDFTNADIMQIKSSWDIAGVTTATAYTAPSYPAEPVNLFHFANAAIYSGTLTDVTTTALATAGTPLASVRGGSISVKNNLINDRFNIAGSGRKSQQLVGNREVNVKLDIELNGNAMSNNLINDTQICLVLNYTAGSLSTGLETLQVVVPAMYADSELPKSNGDSLIIQGMSFTALNNLTNPLMEINMRTADTAL